MKKSLQLPSGYPELLAELSTRIRSAQLRAAFAVSRELVLLYWSIGREILVRQKTEGWGAKVIDRLGADLQKEFPGVEGFSPRNLKYMRSSGGGLARPRNSATACGTFALGSSPGAARPAQGPGAAGVVPPRRHRIRLEPERPGASDQERASGEGREGASPTFSGRCRLRTPIWPNRS